jgi:hypothetical protein
MHKCKKVELNIIGLAKIKMLKNYHSIGQAMDLKYFDLFVYVKFNLIN